MRIMFARINFFLHLFSLLLILPVKKCILNLSDLFAGVSQNYSLQSVDSFGTTLGQEIVTNFAHNVTKEEICSRPSSPVSKGTTESYSSTSINSNSHEDRKPSPPAPVESPSAVNLTSTERASPTTNNHHHPPSSPVNSSLGKLQDCLRHNIDKYANETLNTLNISRCVRELLSVHNIGQRLFAKFVLGLSQGTVSELLSKPKPWDKLTEKGRDSYRKMHAWASDDHCIGILKSLVPRRGKFKCGLYNMCICRSQCCN